jgi:hypothetical protein
MFLAVQGGDLADPIEDLTQQFIQKSAELRALEDTQKYLKAVVKIATFRKQIYAQGLKAVKLDERIESIDWWTRTVKIGAAAGIGMAVGAFVGPAVIAWLSSSSAGAWGAATTGLSAGFLARLTVRGGTMAISGQVQKHVSGSSNLPASSVLGLVFEGSYNQQCQRSLHEVKFIMLNWTDASLVPLILADDFEFIMLLERTYRTAAMLEGVSRTEAEHAKTRFCLEFWTKLEDTLNKALISNGWPGKIASLTGEVDRLKKQLENATLKAAGVR